MAGTVALVLGSGGARGMAHIGVIEELESRGYEIVSVSGCSMGAVIGGFYSAHKLDIFYQWAKSLNYIEVLKLVDFSLISNGAIRGDKLFSVLLEMLGDIQIEDLPVPFTAVATDLISSKEVWFQRGSLEQAMRASVAIPGLIQPVQDKNRLYVDGGVLNPLPIAPTVSAHADYIIAVDLNGDVPIPKLDQNGNLQIEQPILPDVEHSAVSKESLESSESLESKEHGGESENAHNHETPWLDSMMEKASSWFSGDGASADALSSDGSKVNNKEQNDMSDLGKLGILYQMFEVMQASLSQYKIAGYPPDLLVKMPKTSGEIYEFYRTEELVNIGRYIAKEALDSFEQGHSSLYAQRLG